MEKGKKKPKNFGMTPQEINGLFITFNNAGIDGCSATEVYNRIQKMTGGRNGLTPAMVKRYITRHTECFEISVDRSKKPAKDKYGGQKYWLIDKRPACLEPVDIPF